MSGKSAAPPTPAGSTSSAPPINFFKYMSDGLIHFGNKTYDIRYKDTDVSRRNMYFTKGTGELSEGEQALLKDIGITLPETAQLPEFATRLHLVKFFEELPYCQSATALTTSIKCLTPRHLINRLLEDAAYQQSIAYQKDMNKMGASWDFLAKADQMLKGIGSSITGPTPLPSDAKKLTPDQQRKDTNAIYDLFELRI